jgi:hypothetical protein
MPDFGTVALSNINGLADFYASGKAEADAQQARTAAQLGVNTLGAQTQLVQDQAQSANQDLADRGVVRDQAGNLASADPATQQLAAAQLATHGGSTGLNALSQSANQRLQLLQYQQGLFRYPGSGTPASGQPAAPANSGTAPGAGASGAPADGFIDQMNSAESSGRSDVVNASGYAGNFQFGAPRLAQLGLYAPAQGEIDANGKWNGQMGGTFNIPGFPGVKTKADFLASPQAQRAAMGVQVADIDGAIAQTPGADKLDPNGLRAVAHLGGVEGMQKFVASGGQFDPGDNPKAPGGGTHLSDYYRRFSGPGGAQALQQAHGHPDGPLPSGGPQTATRTQPAAPSAAPAGQPTTAAASAQAATAGSAPPAAPGNPQYATRGAMPGDTVSGAGAGVAAPNAGAPAAGASPAQAAAPSAVAPAPGPAVANQNGVYQLGTQDGAVGPAPQNQIAAAAPAPLAVRPAASAPAAAPPQAGGNLDLSAPIRPMTPGEAPPGQTYNFARNGLGAYQTAGLSPGYAMAQTLDANGRVIETKPQRIPIPEELTMEHDRDGGLSVIGKSTGVVYRQVPPRDIATLEHGDPSTPEYAGAYARTVQAGTHVGENGQVVSPSLPYRPPAAAGSGAGGGSSGLNGTAAPLGTPTVSYSGRPQQNSAYEADQKTIKDITETGQAAQANMPRLNEMADLINQVRTGGLVPDLRAKISTVLQSFGASPETLASLSGLSSGSAAELLTKISVSMAGAQGKENAGANNGIQSTQLYQKANPGMNLLPDANMRVTNMLRVANQATQDYANAANADFGPKEQAFLRGGAYDQPLTTFNRQWQTQANPQVYAAATGILNGDSYQSWSARLKDPADLQRAQQIAQRVDPDVTIPQKGAGPIDRLAATRARPGAPAIGTVMQGHAFLGGDPSSPASWRPVAPPAATETPSAPIN